MYFTSLISLIKTTVCGRKRKTNIEPSRPLIETTKISPRIVATTRVTDVCKERLHFIDEKAVVNGKYCLENLLPKLVIPMLENQFESSSP